MKIKTVLTIFATFALIAQMPILTLSQISGFAPAAAGGFSQFSMPQNLGTTVNSPNAEELPVIAPSGLSLYFASDRPGGLGGRDIWVSQRSTLSSAWGTPQNVAPLNSSSNEAPSHISLNGLVMFMNSNRTGAGGIGGVDIYISTRTDPNNDSGWSAPINIGAVVNSNLSDQNPFYFEDPLTGAGTLYFSSDRASGTNNVKDIYQSTRNPDGTFNPPTSVNELNSSADDNKPAVSRDGLEIYFSSDRTTRAIYVSTRASTTSSWNPPVVVGNLSAGGTAAQPSFSPDGTFLYLASDRPGGSGGAGDLYSAVRVSVNRTPPGDFDGDGRSDISVFRPSDGTWYMLQSGTNTFRAVRFGLPGDKIAPGDYDGDGRNDFAIFRPATGAWWIMRSSNNAVSVTNWGLATDKTVPADYDGDGRTDIAVFRDGIWYIIQSSNGNFTYQQFGLGSDIPIIANGQ